MSDIESHDPPVDELKNIVEAAIMISDTPLTLDRILTMFPENARPDRQLVRDVITTLEQEYAGRGIELRRIDKGWRMQTHSDYAPWLSRLQAERPQRYSRALLETLAIIAYRQPVTRGEIEDIRGVAVSTDIIRTLQERDWVRQVGVRDVPGKPALFGTTRAFLEYFNLSSLSEMPALADIRDLEAIASELNLKLPLETDGAGEEAGDEQVADEPAQESLALDDAAADSEASDTPSA